MVDRSYIEKVCSKYSTGFDLSLLFLSNPLNKDDDDYNKYEDHSSMFDISFFFLKQHNQIHEFLDDLLISRFLFKINKGTAIF